MGWMLLPILTSTTDIPSPKPFFDGLLKVLDFLQADKIMDLVVKDLERHGIIIYVVIYLIARIILEALVWKRLLKRWTRRQNG